MSTMQSQPPPPPVAAPYRSMSPLAANSMIGSLVSVFGVVLVMLAGGFVLLAAYILRNALLMPWTHETEPVQGVYIGLAVVCSICAIVAFIFGLKVISKGLRRLTELPGSSSV